jgi:hypothetical protein
VRLLQPVVDGRFGKPDLRGDFPAAQAEESQFRDFGQPGLPQFAESGPGGGCIFSWLMRVSLQGLGQRDYG